MACGLVAFCYAFFGVYSFTSHAAGALHRSARAIDSPNVVLWGSFSGSKKITRTASKIHFTVSDFMTILSKLAFYQKVILTSGDFMTILQ